MKRQLERLKGKRLVTGDANLMTKNEICINTTSDGGVEVKEIGVDGKIKDLAGGSSSDGKIKYYKTKFKDHDDEEYGYLAVNVMISACDTLKVNIYNGWVPEEESLIASLHTTSGDLAMAFNKAYGMSFIFRACTTRNNKIETINNDSVLVFNTFEEYYSYRRTLEIELVGGGEIPPFDYYFEEITEEEFNKI